MAEARLKAKIRVQALIRQCEHDGAFAAVLHAGDPDAGTLLVKVVRAGDGIAGHTAEVLTQVRDGEGRSAWLRGTGPAPVPEAEADAYIARQIRYDADLWVVEIDSRDGRHPLADPIL